MQKWWKIRVVAVVWKQDNVPLSLWHLLSENEEILYETKPKL